MATQERNTEEFRLSASSFRTVSAKTCFLYDCSTRPAIRVVICIPKAMNRWMAALINYEVVEEILYTIIIVAH